MLHSVVLCCHPNVELSIPGKAVITSTVSALHERAAALGLERNWQRCRGAPVYYSRLPPRYTFKLVRAGLDVAVDCVVNVGLVDVKASDVFASLR